MAKKNSATVNVNLKLSIDIVIELTADTLEAAIAQARSLKLEDIIDTKMLTIDDSEIAVSGAFLVD